MVLSTLTTLLSAAATVTALVCLSWHASKLGLMERPDGHRTHDLPTPVIGGIGMAVGLLVAWLASGHIAPGTPVALGALGLIAIGIQDDRNGMSARRKLLAQLSVVTVAAAFDADLVFSLGQLVPGVEIRLHALALPFTVFAILGLINAVNMLDGLDGLAGKVVLVAFGWFAACMWMVGGWTRLTLDVAAMGAIGAFLAFNARFPGRPRALLFMGDTGSMLLGYLLAMAAIDATQRPNGIPPVTALWICALPILDTLVVTAQRLLDGRAPMASGRDHLHHLLRAHDLPVGKVAMIEAAIALLAGLVGVAGWRLGVPEWLMFASFVAVGLGYHQLFRVAWRRVRAREAATAARAPQAVEPDTEPLTVPMAMEPLMEPLTALRLAPPQPAPLASAGEAGAAKRVEPAHAESSV